MKSVIVGTAGHIDHGKTALVKALTGIDADRLEEEKRRGITIDLGFAHLELAAPDGAPLRLGFVDVPGHERFVRNMLAGVGGIDLVLLVVAADEGIKPQTREHFDICRLLNVCRGLTVVTKSDLVDADTLAVVRLELEDYLRDSFLEGTPVVAVSALTGAGMEELKQELARAAAEAPMRDSAALFRLPIDRVFTMKGFGTVVTGTLISGAVRKEEEVEVFPGRQPVRVRGVQVHNQAAEQAVAGQRTALNLAGVAKEELARGMMLASPGLLQPTTHADVSLSLLPSARKLKNRARVHLHVYATETVAEVFLYDAGALAPGKSGFAQLRLQEPALLLPGDRFIIRQFSPVVTIGGGVVLDALPARRKAAGHEAFLQVLASGGPVEVLAARVGRRSQDGLTLTQAVAETGWPLERVEEAAAELLTGGAMLRLSDLLLQARQGEEVKASLLERLRHFHERNPLLPGMNREELREESAVSPRVFAGVLEILVREKKVELASDIARLAGRGVTMTPEEARAREIIERAFAQAGLKVPALKEVLAGLKVERAAAQKIVTLLLRERVLVKLADELVFHRDALAGLRQMLADYKQQSSKLDVARFKDLAGVSRKYAIPLLEYLDRERVTRRVGDERVIL